MSANLGTGKVTYYLLFRLRGSRGGGAGARGQAGGRPGEGGGRGEAGGGTGGGPGGGPGGGAQQLPGGHQGVQPDEVASQARQGEGQGDHRRPPLRERHQPGVAAHPYTNTAMSTVIS